MDGGLGIEMAGGVRTPLLTIAEVVIVEGGAVPAHHADAGPGFAQAGARTARIVLSTGIAVVASRAVLRQERLAEARLRAALAPRTPPVAAGIAADLAAGDHQAVSIHATHDPVAKIAVAGRGRAVGDRLAEETRRTGAPSAATTSVADVVRSTGLAVVTGRAG